MKIPVEDVRYAAKLAKLSITYVQAQKMVKEFEVILTHFESIGRLDLRDVLSDPWDRNADTVFRRDEVSVFEDKKKLFLNSKSMRDSYIRVPKIIE